MTIWISVIRLTRFRCSESAGFRLQSALSNAPYKSDLPYKNRLFTYPKKKTFSFLDRYFFALTPQPPSKTETATEPVPALRQFSLLFPSDPGTRFPVRLTVLTAQAFICLQSESAPQKCTRRGDAVIFRVTHGTNPTSAMV